MSEQEIEKASTVEMLSFGGTQFAASIYMAFMSYYLMMFCTDVALIPSATTAVILFCFRLFSAVDTQAISLFINRAHPRGGRYRPYIKWGALPFGIGLVALGLTPGVKSAGRVIYIAFMLAICELSWSVLYTSSMSMLPYLAQDDVNRTKFMSFSNSSAIIAYILVGTFTLPLAAFFGGDDRSKGIALTLVLFAAIAIPLCYNAYFRLKERQYGETQNNPALKDVFLAIGRNKRIMIFLAGFCLYQMADAFKNLTAYYYMTYILERADLLPVVILAGLLSPLAVQPIIPRLLIYAKKENLIVFGLFAASCASLLMLIAGNRPAALIICVVLYGAFTAIVANLSFIVTASFSDEVRTRQNISMSEILTASMNLSSNIGSAIASGAAAIALAAFGYSAQAATQPVGALLTIKALYILCTASCMALAGIVLLHFRKKQRSAVS